MKKGGDSEKNKRSGKSILNFFRSSEDYSFWYVIVFALVALATSYILLNSYNSFPEISPDQVAKVNILVEKDSYNNGEKMRIQIRNNFAGRICFSSCYPYFLERETKGKWIRYNYAKCPWENVNRNCLKPGEAKAFEVSPSKVKAGIHRLVLPVCEGCVEKNPFKTSFKFYSPEFKIN